jgi:Tol biopolymer transport system component
VALTLGTRLGVYDITAPIGEGGMGQVFRARDRKLNRDVALKVLPDSFASDPDRLARFAREAQTLASLNHPHIAGIYGLEESGGVSALVMELVEGEDLSQRIARGAIPLDEALPIAKQIAEALEAAHEQGIIHRDLKPANIKVRADGTVKVLDFGLAKAIDPAGMSSMNALNSPTLSLHATMQGVILGTAAYMSPEQAKGRRVDRRTDIFAFGCVLFEMLTGRRAFEGDDVAEIVSRVLQREPDWTLLSGDVPPRVRELLRLCLEKDPKQRRSSAADLQLDLEPAARASSSPAAAATAPGKRRAIPMLVTAATALVAVGVLIGWRLPRPSPPALPLRMSLMPPPYGFGLDVDPAVSPDGRTVAFVAPDAAGTSQLWLRPLDSPTPRALTGTAGALMPFWSHDGKWIAFVAQGKLKKVPLTGESPQTLADSPLLRGGTWNERGDILYVPTSFEPIHRVSAAGGDAAPLRLTGLPEGQLEGRQGYPQFLPDGRHFLLTVGRSLAVGSLDAPEVKIVLPNVGSRAEYANGHLVFVRDGDIYAQPFDVSRLALGGGPVKIADNVGFTMQTPLGFAFSTAPGVIAYWDRSAQATSQLAWFDRSGRRLGTLGEPGEYVGLALSPDERRVAVEMHEPKSGRVSVWLIDAATGVRSRFTSYDTWTALPQWSADSTRLLVADFSERFHILPVAGGPSRDVDVGRGAKWPTDWSRDGRFVVYFEARERTTVGVATVDAPRPAPYLQTAFNEGQAKISPDGSWLVYVSDEAGRQEVYVQSFPQPGRKLLISAHGGAYPIWRGDGLAVFYLSPTGELMEAELSQRNGGLDVRATQVLFHAMDITQNRTVAGRTPYAVASNGQRFLFSRRTPDAEPKAVTTILNWNPAR